MQDKKYLLSISELLEIDVAEELQTLLQRCLKWLDAERLNRVKRLMGKEDMDGEAVLGSSARMNRKLAENIGAGMLLQLAVLQILSEQKQPDTEKQSIFCLTITELLTCLEESGQPPLPLEYTYGENGKPYLKNYPGYFNLSHSGEYIFCVISPQEVGVDIQYTKPLKDDRVARRFFSEEEKRSLVACETEQERQELFYRLWACKEAYGKLTGQGIVAALDISMGLGNGASKCTGNMGDSGRLKEFILQEYKIENYQIAVCKWKQES